jgi:hypothetical protein
MMLEGGRFSGYTGRPSARPLGDGLAVTIEVRPSTAGQPAEGANDTRASATSALQAVLKAAAIPHGFTLAIWGTSALEISARGRPNPVSVLCFITAASCAYAVLRIACVAFNRNLDIHVSGGGPATSPLVAILLAAFLPHWLLGGVSPRGLAWGLCGAASCAVYFAASAGQLWAELIWSGRANRGT